jgi:hypothetical protein
VHFFGRSNIDYAPVATNYLRQRRCPQEFPNDQAYVHHEAAPIFEQSLYQRVPSGNVEFVSNRQYYGSGRLEFGIGRECYSY